VSSLFSPASSQRFIDKRDSVVDCGSPLPLWMTASTCGHGFMHQPMSGLGPFGSRLTIEIIATATLRFFYSIEIIQFQLRLL
jgi:hypothetical protein